MLDAARHRVEKEGSELSLKPTEFRVLKLLTRQPGIAISYSTLLAEALGAEVLQRQSEQLAGCHQWLAQEA